MEIIAAAEGPLTLSEFETAVQKLETLETMPVVAQRLVAITAQDDCGIREVQDLVATDQSLAARMMKLASAPIYGSRPASNLRAALIRIGLDDIRRLVIAAAMVGTHGGRSKFHQTLWRYSVECGAIAEMIGHELDDARLDDPFLLGLLHDFGTLVLSSLRGKSYRQLVPEPGTEAQRQAERDALGFDHCDIGAMVAAQWNLFPALEAVMQFHHEPLLAEELDLDPTVQRSVYLVALARQQVLREPDRDPELVVSLAHRLGLDCEEVDELTERGRDRFQRMYASLLDSRG